MTGLCRNLIGGEWVAGGDAFENRNPARPDDLVGIHAVAAARDVDAAVAAARAAQPGWAAVGPQARSDVLMRAGRAILARADEIGRLLAREEGKTLPEATGEAIRAGHVFQFFAGEALRLAGLKIDSARPGVEVDVMREPLGVVGLITPWNFPIAIPAWKSAPALAAGNAVVLKPAELTPACAHVLAQILQEAGAPAGVFNLVVGPGAAAGRALVEHPGVDALSFTGSAAVGRGIAAACAAGMKKVQLEMGGKNPLVVTAEADLGVAVGAALNGAFFSTGQRCTASSRLIVEDRIHDAFVERLEAARAAMAVGDPLEEGVAMGPVVSERQLEAILGYVALAREEGCEVLGGGRLDRPGHFMAPALLLNAANDMRSAREEIFGPCASVIRVGDFDEALHVANDTAYGLSAGICTRSLSQATRFRRGVRAGMVMVNLPTAGVDHHVPFGGRRASSLGQREQGPMAMEFYTAVKTAYVAAG